MKHRVPFGSACRASLAALLALAANPTAGQTKRIWVGPNVNMVSGTTWPDGDPFLQRQNEPSIAVSTRNPLHLLAGANDYRTVDLPGLPEGKETGDAWLGVFRSANGGGSWTSTLVRGYPQEQGSASPPYGYEAAADPVVRAGTHGLFYYSGIVFDRSLLRSGVFVQRFMDLNNETVEPVRYVDTVLVDSFGAGEAFIDKPWLEVDIPRAGAQTVTLEVPQGSGTVSQTVPCGNVYLAWAQITGQGPSLRTLIMFSRSTDCGATWSNPYPLSLTGTVGQGATIALAPGTGRVYVSWRQFHSATGDCVQEKSFWKITPSAWPVGSLLVGGVSYTKAQALVILQKSYPPSDAPGILAQQLIPAKLNVLSGANCDAIRQVIADADAWLVRYPLGSKPPSPQKLVGLALKDKLEAFNKGLSGSPTCTSATTTYPDAILVAHSDDAGLSFSAPLQVATVSPFDQGTSEYSFRTNAYPTMAVDETGRAYLAWATRGLATPNSGSVGGDARIVVTTSRGGTTWTTPRVIDQPAKPGHQLFPSLTFNAGKLMLVYNDYRSDFSDLFERFVVDLLDPTRPTRHTVDVRAAVAAPADVPLFTDYSVLMSSDQVSRYPFIVTASGAGDAAALQLQYNPPNLPMFELGHKPFFGDYHDVAGAPRFVPGGNGAWGFNTAPSTAPVFQAVWTDNRDVVGPPDGNWSNYVPPGTDSHISLFDGSTLVPNCETVTGGADRTQMRNQNIYTSRLASGLFVAVPSNARPLSPDFQRAFVVFVQNATDAAKQFELRILNQPAGGGSASFEQFGTVVDAVSPVSIPAYSSISQAVFVSSGDAAASVNVRVRELGSCAGTSSCLESTVQINPDASNPPPADPTLLAGEVYNPAVYNPAVYNPAVYNPAVFNPAVFNPAVFNDSVINYDLTNPAVFNPAVLNPAVFNPAVFNPAVFNLAVTSLAVLNPAVFNPAVFNPAVFNPAVFNPAVFNPAVFNPAVFNPAVFNPAVFNPAVLNPAVFNPAVFNTAIADGSVTEANFATQNTGNTTTAYSFNLNLANQQSGLIYQLMIYRLYFVPVANGCELTEAAQQELLVNDLAPNLAASLFDPDGGASFYLGPGDVAVATLRVLPDPDAPTPGDPSQFNLGDLSVSVVAKSVNTADAAAGDTQPRFAEVLAPSLPPLLITTATLPDGAVGGAYAAPLAAAGGSGPLTWSAVGTLPPGVSLSPAGALVGTATTAGTFTFTVRVTDGTQLAAQALSLDVLVASLPATLTFTVQPSDATGGQAMPVVSVEARDAASAPVPGVSLTMTLGSAGCAAATLTGVTTAVTNAAGVATFSALVTDKGGWGYSLTATVDAAPAVNVTSGSFDVEGFCDTGIPSIERFNTTSTGLADGRVLLAGGNDSGTTILETAEIYDPSTSAFTPTTGTLNVARYGHAAVLLPDGTVLIVGGESAGGLTTVAEIFDPVTQSFSTTSGGLGTGRYNFSATWVPSAAKVLIAGGQTSTGITSSFEVYDPTTRTFTPGGGMNMTQARASHSAAPLADGRVLIVGGEDPSGNSLNSAEVWDPSTGAFTVTGSLAAARSAHGAVALSDARVLIAGGHLESAFVNVSSLASAEIFDPVSGTFSAAGAMGSTRDFPAVAGLPSGEVLVAAGRGVKTAELFDPLSNTFTPTGALTNAYYGSYAVPLSTSLVLIAGGGPTADLFYPLPPTIFLVTNTLDSGPGSLRQCILDANANPGLDEIHFAIPGAGVQSISPASALPTITDPVRLDATTQPGYAATPLIRVDGASVGGTVNGLEILAANSLVKGFMITRFPAHGIEVTHATATRLVGNFVGTDGSGALGNGVGGIRLSGCSAGLVDGNVVSANNGMGLALVQGLDLRTSHDNHVLNNKVGVDASGAVPLGNAEIGVYIDNATYNTLRGNVISGNAATGVWLVGSLYNRLVGNRIGTNAAGTVGMPVSGSSGIGMWAATSNVIGGPAPADANVISGNGGYGIYLGPNCAGNTISGNRVGTDAAGAIAVANQMSGIHLEGLDGSEVTANRIENNILSGNAWNAVSLSKAATHNTVVGNRIGTNALGGGALPNGGAGVLLLDGAHDNTVGGLGPSDANLISGNGANGITLDANAGAVTGTVIAGNMIGTDALGTGALGNTGDGIGIYAGANSNTVSDNVVAGSTNNGIRVLNATGNTIRHNWIGTNAALAVGLGNGDQGISVEGSSGTTIGGTEPGDGNVVASNGDGGILLEGGATSTQIQGNVVSGNTGSGIGVQDSQTVTITGNLVGTNAAGTLAWPNAGTGISVTGAGTTAVTVRDNLVSGNAMHGIYLTAATHHNAILGNKVGTDLSGASAIPNAWGGVLAAGGAHDNTIGGAGPTDGNLVSGNLASGIWLEQVSLNTVQGNWVGVNGAGVVALGNENEGIMLSGGGCTGNTVSANVVSGNRWGVRLLGSGPGDGPYGNSVVGNIVGLDPTSTAPIPNDSGVMLYQGAHDNTVGGTAPGSGNIIAGNTYGMLVVWADGNAIQGNWVGTNLALASGLGNTAVGISISASSNTLIGGSAAGAGNVIAYNGGRGVVADSGLGNAIQSNSFFGNALLGIDLGNNGVTLNDPGDTDTGANDLVNFPVLTLAADDGSQTTVAGSVDVGVPGVTLTLQFFANDACDPSGYGEGQTLVGSTSVVTGGGGTATFSVNLPTGLAGKSLAATTNTLLGPGGNTSEFSACITVVGL
ncbi:MAG: right-handed parallel beta-helix repeat-containing protein [Acidobacteria bacterium]|nr:right-handed parallel beta-helix repeat-containing protein [Acidobacteriota bacterium]